MVTKRFRVVAEAPPATDAVTPTPLNEAAVTLVKLVPVTMTVNDVPAAPATGNKDVTEGGARDCGSPRTEPPVKANSNAMKIR